jgi:hypothetical protein
MKGGIAMTKFNWGDPAFVKDDAPIEYKPGSLVHVVGISADSSDPVEWDERFPEGVVYTIEFENGDSIDVEEAALRQYEDYAAKQTGQKE